MNFIKYKILNILPFLLVSLFLIQAISGGITEGISFTHELRNGSVVIKTSYSSNYGAGMWKITDNKDVIIKLEVLEKPDNITLLVEHMHADVSIHSYKQHVDGLPQDTMDDKIHEGDQAGFLITEDYPYEEIFAVEGYSKFLIEGWGFLIGYYGWTTIKEKRLTEDNLKNVGTVGSEITIVYDILMKNDNEDYWYKEVFKDSFYIFFNGEFEETTEEEEQKTLKKVMMSPDSFQAIMFGIGIVLFFIGLVGGIISEEFRVIAIILIVIGTILMIASLGTSFKEVIVTE